MNATSLGKKGAVLGLMALSLMVGAAEGSALSQGNANAQTASTIPTATTAQVQTPAQGSVDKGTFKSNKDPAHEKGESAAREAQEDAGIRPTAQ